MNYAKVLSNKAERMILKAYQKRDGSILGYREFEGLFENHNGDEVVRELISKYENIPDFRKAVDYFDRYIPIEYWIKNYKLPSLF